MLLDAVIVVLGFVGLVWGADKFVYGASALARNLGVSPLTIGLTIAAFGTSAPEIFSSAVAAMVGRPELAIGNALGSNMFNVGVALGVAAVIRPLVPPDSLSSKELPALLLVTLVTGALLFDLRLGLLDALVLIAIAVFFGYRLVGGGALLGELPAVEAGEEDRIGNLRAALYLLLGLALLVLGAEALVRAATSIAEGLGVSAAIIGLTVIALGTSLPELVLSVTCVSKGHHELAIGNIVGSNIWNLLVVLPFPGLFGPSAVEPFLLERDYTAMLLLTALLAGFCLYGIRRRRKIGRVSGIIFLSVYCGWFALMLMDVQRAAAS